MKLQNHFIFEFLIFLGEISPVKKKGAVEEFVQENTSPYLPRQCFPITTGLHPPWRLQLSPALLDELRLHFLDELSSSFVDELFAAGGGREVGERCCL